MTAIVDLDPATADTLHSALGPDSQVLPSLDALRRHLETQLGEDAVVLGPTVDLSSALGLAGSMRVTRPSLAVILVRRRVDTSVLTEALRAGVFEVVEERDLAGLNASVRRARDLARQLRETVAGVEAEPAAHSRGQLITVFSAKGGCGKTTLATNLAAALADRGRREVCLVDLDLAFGDVAIALQLFPAHTIADAVPLGRQPGRLRRGLAADAALPRPDHPGGADRAGHGRVRSPRRWSSAILDRPQAAVRLRRSSTRRRRSTTTCSPPSTRATWSRCWPRWTSRR